jgi:pimeloyl-ACP methyl ester carboxylesterase
MRLLHGRVPIELHTLKAGQGRPLLLLHALGENADGWPEPYLDWSSGPVFALDFAGHGNSGRLAGGAYYPEYFLADADLALAGFGEGCVLVGSGVGAYVALMLAGSRPESVLGALLQDGAGLHGVGSDPDSEIKIEDITGFEALVAEAAKAFAPGTDPYVAQCAWDMRPIDYAKSFAEAARPLLFSPDVRASTPPPMWWQAAREVNLGKRATGDLSEDLRLLAEIPSNSRMASKG